MSGFGFNSRKFNVCFRLVSHIAAWMVVKRGIIEEAFAKIA